MTKSDAAHRLSEAMCRDGGRTGQQFPFQHRTLYSNAAFFESSFSEKASDYGTCPRVREQFQFFERVMFQNIGTVSEEDLIEKLEREDQALCIVNTKKRAQNLYRKMKGEGVFHLSTAMYRTTGEGFWKKSESCCKRENDVF